MEGLSVTVLPRIMKFGRIRIPNIIHIFKNDEYEYEYYLEFKNYSNIIHGKYSNNWTELFE